jgi:hypothetical protein
VAVTSEPMHQTVDLFGVIIGGAQTSRLDMYNGLSAAGAAETPRVKKRRAAGSLNEKIIIVGRFLKRQNMCAEEGVNTKPGGGRM